MPITDIVSGVGKFSYMPVSNSLSVFFFSFVFGSVFLSIIEMIMEQGLVRVY